MAKILPLLAVGVFAPPLFWLVAGAQLIYASQQARSSRLYGKTERLIGLHSGMAPSFRS